MISVSNVTMRYGSKVLFEDVSVSFVPGRRYGLTGPNGSGKSNGNGSAARVTLGNLGIGHGQVTFSAQADAPSCADCGSIMVRNGSCYKCLNCGSTSGCS